MKKMRFLPFMLIALFFMASFTSCNKDDEIVGSGSVEAKINGITIKFDKVNAAQGEGGIAIIASTNDGKSLTILIPDNIKEGTYDLSFDDVMYSILYNDGNTIYGSVSGTIEITSHNEGSNKIKGKFNFTGVDAMEATVDVTDGTFDVSYEEAK
jgi:hypothetical protein